MRKKLSNNSEVYHVYAQQNQAEGYNGNCSFNNNLAYSYSQCIGNIQGDYIFLINWNYSNTTSKHNNDLFSASSHYYQIFVTRPGDPESQSNIEDFETQLNDLIKKFARARTNKSFYLDQIERLKTNVSLYKKALNIENETVDKIINFAMNEKELEKVKEQIEIERAAEREKRKQKEIEKQKAIEDWKNFKTDYISMSYYSSNAYLRLRNGIIETSKNIKISFEKVNPLIKLYQQYIKTNNENILEHLIGRHLDSYTINQVNKDFVKIGCHNIPKNEILNLV